MAQPLRHLRQFLLADITAVMATLMVNGEHTTFFQFIHV